MAARCIACLLLLAALSLAARASSSTADLTSSYQAGQERSARLRAAIDNETSRIGDYQGTISSLQARLGAIERSVSIQQALLASVDRQLAAARARLTQLHTEYTRDRAVLAAELRAKYESPPPTIVGVVVSSAGFEQLLNGIGYLTTIERRNLHAAQVVRDARAAVREQTIALARVHARRRRATAAVIAERDQVAQLKLSIVDRELKVIHARARDRRRLEVLHRTLAHEANILDQRAAAAQTLSSDGAVAPPGGCVNTPFVPHGGEFGFFPAAGTNYSVNQEPIIAGRLDQLGRALQLHLIGISGYRTPEHSVAVGGFADDPHTEGEASDTPGVEGVPESTLEQFCLTRQFGGTREADHIQEN